MSLNPSARRRRRTGAVTAICGGGAASSISVAAAGHHAADAVPHAPIWSDVGIAVAIGLVIAIIACAVAARRSC